MFYSADINFVAAALLTIISIYTIKKTHESGYLTFMLFAVTPIILAIQQCLEGILRLAISGCILVEMQTLDRFSALYLFLSILIWPTYVPLALAVFETKKKPFYIATTIFGLVFSICLILFKTNSTAHSTYALQTNSVELIWSLILYFLFTSGSLLFASWSKTRILGVIIFISMIIASLSYNIPFIALSNFLILFVSLYIAYMAHLLSQKSTRC